MRIWPIIVDSAPAYLGEAQSSAASLLATPFGEGAVLDRLRSWIPSSTRNAPIVLSPACRDAQYRERIQALADTGSNHIRIVCGWEEFAELIASFELSDGLLFVDPQCFPKRDPDLSS